MWAFLRKRVRKREAHGMFAECVSAEGLQALESAFEKRSDGVPPLKMEAVSYLIFQVRGDSPEVIQRHLAQAFEIIIDNDCLIESIMSSIAVASFKTKVATYEQLLEALHTQLGPNIRVVHGRGEYPHGIFGSQRRLSYGTIFPDITSKLEALFTVEFGTSREI